MKNRGHITGFYLETLLLIVVFIAIILVITQVFGIGKAQSTEARLLTNAVTLAQNAAEAFYAAEDEAALVTLLNENGNAAAPYGYTGALQPEGVSLITAHYSADMAPNPNRDYRLIVTVAWTDRGDAKEGTVTVTDAVNLRELYSLPLYKNTEVTP